MDDLSSPNACRTRSVPEASISLHTALVLWFLLSINVESANAQPPELPAGLAAAIDKLVEKNGITSKTPGLAILVQQPGKLKFMKAYGLASVERHEPITSKTMFELASVSKTFTATAVLILHDRGKLSIDDDIRKQLPEFPEYQKGRPIRIRDLLHHISGVPDYMDLEDIPARHGAYSTNDDYLVCFAKQKQKFPLDFPTGQKYDYNNSNYLLLASIAERASGKPFRQFLHDEVFVPAGMTHSFVYSDPKTVPKPSKEYGHAVGYEWKKKKEIWQPGWGTPPDRHEQMLTFGDGSVWTNLEDMSHWDLAIRERKFLKPETWKMALTPSKTKDGETNDYGLGWSLYYDDPKELYGFGHDGSWSGFKTTYYLYLTHDRTTVLLSNRGNFDTDKFWESLDKVIQKHSP